MAVMNISTKFNIDPLGGLFGNAHGQTNERYVKPISRGSNSYLKIQWIMEVFTCQIILNIEQW